ncbi:ribokinase [Streptomyces eurocidicus]|uniref:Ribokinase n=1 Tax=Streptomyces eurocidicus TaxID=66423 RepID=A0A2N8NZK7_STREU|nr:ribokinase [Streptomyces eurocidicus]MBB5118687.1 ribokinase [Streptomyces eurocidicus]MBF6051498.1 ribokinase [Streptomyces eurocidicus]PNE34208.1 ribokinase [Streptomyces eurocidicus]
MSERENVYDVLVVGSANADLTVRVDRRPVAGETVLGTDLVESAGGKGANQAAAAARLGARTALLAKVGDDAFGELLLDGQRAAGTDVRHVRVEKGARTGTAMIVVGPDGDNTIVVSPGANARLSPADVAEAREAVAASAVVSLQLEIPPETVRAAVAVARETGARVVLNPSPAPSELAPGLLAAADPLVVNEHEARQLSGLAGGGPEDWARALRERGARSVVVTLGGDGALVLDAGPAAGRTTASGAGPGAGPATDEAVRVPGVRVEAVDTTGAGDAFTGALAARLARGASLAGAARYAVRVGAASVTRPGAQPSYPTEEELPDGPGSFA